MVGNVGPSPKRRKTTQAPAPVTASAIAHANSTAQFFTGQLQNRWMHTAQTADQRAPAPGTAGSRRDDEQPQPRPDNSPTVAHREMIPHTPVPSASGHTGAYSPMAAQAALQMTAGGSLSPAVSIATSNLVNYESPAAVTTQAHVTQTAASARSRSGSISRPLSISRPQEQQSLPSPVSRDGNMNSPAAFGQQRLPTAMPAPAQPRRGRPPRSTSMPQAHAAGPPQAQTKAPHATSRSSHEAQHPQPFSNGGFSGTVFNPQSMLNRLDVFAKSVPREQQIDHGRLALLQEAIRKQDWFYIVLSQIHALSSNLLSLPAVARNPTGFTCLDTILATNSNVSPRVLQALSAFPTPIVDIYSSTDKDVYGSHVRGVAQFLHLLPMHWDGLIRACKQLQAPPLVEDLWECFRLPSKVLQTTMFRAIGRMITATDEHASGNVDGLEPLHLLNQDAFYRGQRRAGEDRTFTYAALRRALQSWQIYRAYVKSFRTEQSNLPPDERARLQHFVMPPEVENFFRSAPSQNAPVGTNGGPTTDAARATAQRDVFSNSNPLNMRQSYTQPIVAPQQQPPGPHLMFPHESAQARPLPTQPDPIQSGLHQAHLRSPSLTPARTNGEEKPKPCLYRYVMSTFPLSPSSIDRNTPINVFKFFIDEDAFAKMPRPPSDAVGETSLTIDSSSLTYRLRCVAIPPQGIPDTRTWIQADTVWPEGLFLDLNGQMLETRKKLHHGRNLPVNLTPHIQLGENVLRLAINRVPTDTRPFAYAVAVEMVGVKTHEGIITSVTRIESTDSMEAIKKSLSAECGSDDDFAITSSKLTISLFDPYSGDRMVRTPVRGSGCLHRDCFDLEIFLSMCKRTHPDGPTAVDCWRCPICRGDVRPQTLVKDEFLIEVLTELQSKALNSTRAIVVNQDGSWRPKEEEHSGVRSPSLEREERADSKAKESAKRVVEVIELD